MILNIRNFSILRNSEFIRDNPHFFKIGVKDGEGEGNVRTYKILGSLEILAIKNCYSSEGFQIFRLVYFEIDFHS